MWPWPVNVGQGLSTEQACKFGTMTKGNIAGTVIIELLFECVKTLPKTI